MLREVGLEYVKSESQFGFVNQWKANLGPSMFEEKISFLDVPHLSYL